MGDHSAAAAFVDANVVIPYLSGHDPGLLAKAQAIIETEAARLLPVAVILETAWVLERAYGYRKRNIAAALLDLLGRDNVSIVGLPKETVIQMFTLWHHGRIGSAGDAIIAASLLVEGTGLIYSFDRRFPRGMGWEVVTAPPAN